MSEKPEKTTVSLVLGSGGARGLAHIGVINWLVDHGYEIRSVSGSSMGALVGGVYATGQLDVFTRWVTALTRVDVLRLLDLSFSSTGLFKGDRVMGVIRDLIGDHQIEDLPITYTAVATDLRTGREVWLDRGSLFDAIRASTAIPTIFTPHEINGRELVDGGLVNPVPISPTARDHTDLVVAVNPASRSRRRTPRRRTRVPEVTQGGRTYRSRIARFVRELMGDDGAVEQDLGLFDVVSRSMDTVQHLVARLQLAAYSPDVLVEISRDVCLVYEFYRAKELIELGWRETEEEFRALDSG